MNTVFIRLNGFINIFLVGILTMELGLPCFARQFVKPT